MDAPLALYDLNTDLRAWWIGDHIWSLDLEWLAFVYDKNVFTAQVNTTWLGPAHDGLLMDHSGHVVLWGEHARVQGDISPYKPPPAPRPPRPERPPRPNLPPRPYKPPRPSDGWSPSTQPLRWRVPLTFGSPAGLPSAG